MVGAHRHQRLAYLGGAGEAQLADDRASRRLAPMTRDEPITTLNTPRGTPARSARTARAKAVKGVWVAGFSTIVQFAAGGAARVIMAAGNSRAIAATTPTGWRIQRCGCRPDGWDLAVNPLGLFREPLDEGRRIGDLALASARGFCSRVNRARSS